jgi:propanol-preferring alcohol dehydrogenase
VVLVAPPNCPINACNATRCVSGITATRNDLADVFALHAAGRTRVITVGRKLDEVNESIADVLACRVPARLVVEL